MAVPGAEQFTQSYNSFAGSDIHVTFGGTLVGEIQGLSFTVTREKAPLYTMGSADPRGFSRGKRGIAGSLIFLTFDRTALLDTMRRNRFMAWRHEAEFESYRNREGSSANLKSVKEFSGSVGSFSTVAVSGQPRDQYPRRLIKSDKVSAEAWYHDQLPPFSIVVTAQNEYGHSMRMEIGGVEIMNYGSGTSIDDITIDESMTFVATYLRKWDEQAYHDPFTGKATPYVPDPGDLGMSAARHTA